MKKKTEITEKANSSVPGQLDKVRIGKRLYKRRSPKIKLKHE